MPGKYAPLENYLRKVPANRKQIVLSFEQIEGILNSKLPASAFEDERWWEHETEGNHVNTRAWTNAGWKVKSVDVNRTRVILVRA